MSFLEPDFGVPRDFLAWKEKRICDSWEESVELGYVHQTHEKLQPLPHLVWGERSVVLSEGRDASTLAVDEAELTGAHRDDASVLDEGLSLNILSVQVDGHRGDQAAHIHLECWGRRESPQLWPKLLASFNELFMDNLTF